MSKLPVSVFIIAKNEADRIGITIGSVSAWAEEVIVIDSGSVDGTMQVAESHGAKAYFNEWPGYGMQKRFGEDKCKNKWLINLDADEAISPELAEEIKALFVGSLERHSGYRLPVCNMLPGETTIPQATQINRVIRLYNKEKARFSESPVHDSVIVKKGTVADLSGPVYHRSYRSLAHAIEKMNHYSSMQADDMIARGQSVSAARLYIEFFISFIKAYFFRQYMFRGRRGFIYAMLYAFSRFTRLAKWSERAHEKEYRP